MIFELCVREAKALECLGSKLFDHIGSFFGVTFAEVLKLEVVDSKELFVPPSLHRESDRPRDPSLFLEPEVPYVRRITSCSFYNYTRWLKCQSVLPPDDLLFKPVDSPVRLRGVLSGSVRR